jgi:hypothetical protein
MQNVLLGVVAISYLDSNSQIVVVASRYTSLQSLFNYWFQACLR